MTTLTSLNIMTTLTNLNKKLQTNDYCNYK